MEKFLRWFQLIAICYLLMESILPYLGNNHSHKLQKHKHSIHARDVALWSFDFGGIDIESVIDGVASKVNDIESDIDDLEYQLRKLKRGY